MLSLAGLRVLIVDDNATNRRIVEETVTQWDMRATSVDGGASALEAVTQASEPFSVILLDLHMPSVDGFMFAERLARLQGPLPTVMMLSSAGHRGDARRCRELGIKAYLLKPLKRSDLLVAMMAALAPPDPAVEGQEELVTRHTIRAEHTPLKILLAEDNRVNQVLAVRLLEKEGHDVTVASDGQMAFDFWSAAKGEPYDVILMDVQMPNVDGFAATALIREAERFSHGHITIIATTAHALEGDRERCLEAGMDEYISKPIVPSALSALLAAESERKLRNATTLAIPR